jgi:hypothetical protein
MATVQRVYRSSTSSLRDASQRRKGTNTMHKKIIGMVYLVMALAMSANAQTVIGSAFEMTATDTFTDPPHTLSNYGLTWADFSGGTIGPSAALSGWGGVNLYTSGARRMTINWYGNVGIGTTSPVSKLHLGVGNGDGITIGNPNDPLGNGGTYAIQFYGFRDIIPNAISAKITAERTDACCNWLAQGTDLAFYTTNSLGTPNADNSIERMRIKDNGNVGIGTTAPAAKLDVNGSINISGAGAGITFPNGGGTQSVAWTGVLCGGDYAEDMRASGRKEAYEPGDVLVLASEDNSDIQKSTEPYSAMVAGIFATKPGVIGRRDAVAKSTDNIPMAMVGVVPTKVISENGPIRKGDLLVTSSSPGYAMRGTDRNRMLGAVIGKAMGTLSTGSGVIEVLVTLQ